MNRRPILAQLFSGVAAAVLALYPVASHAAEPVQLVRAGDHAMGCDALAAEINSLAQPVAAEKPRKKRGGFFKALGSALPFVPMVGTGAMLVQAAGGAAATAAAQAQSNDAMADAQAMARDAMAGPSIEQQRKERLTVIFEEKHC